MVNVYTAVILILSMTLHLLNCHVTKVFTEKVIHWFSESNRSNFDPRTKGLLFGILNSPGPSCKKTQLHPSIYALLHLQEKVKRRSTASSGLHQNNQAKTCF